MKAEATLSNEALFARISEDLVTLRSRFETAKETRQKSNFKLDIDKAKFLIKFRRRNPNHHIAPKYFSRAYETDFIWDVYERVRDGRLDCNERQLNTLNTLYDWAKRYEEFMMEGTGL